MFEHTSRSRDSRRSHRVGGHPARFCSFFGLLALGLGTAASGCAAKGEGLADSTGCTQNCGTGGGGGTSSGEGGTGSVSTSGSGGLGTGQGGSGVGATGGADSGTSPESTGGSPGSGGATQSGSGGVSPIPHYTLQVDAPSSGASVSGSVVVSGWAPGFLNVEVWDAMHTNPPLAQVTPQANGSFSTTVDATLLSSGATTWTVYAWDSSPGQSWSNTASVALNLTVAAAACTGQTCPSNDGTPDPGGTYVPPGYQLVFSDEFSATTLDTSKWNTLAPYGVQWYTSSNQKQAFIPQAVTLADGLATLTTSNSTGNTSGQPYASGSITTNRTFTYGYYEARVRVPWGKGLWPAFWLTSSTRWPPEWDIFEIIDGVIFGYTHPAGGTCYFVDGAAGADSTYVLSDVYGKFHVYGFRWSATDLYWYVDGVMTEHYVVDGAAGSGDAFWLNLMMQVGGDWPGDPDGTTPLPARMDVDYVRVYQ